MIVVSCPLRISLVGGSTDHPYFIEKYNKGAVISFPSNLRTYVSIHQDVFGANSLDNKYIVNYSKRESVESIQEIQNELVRYCFEYTNVGQINCTLTSDIYSAGSGLAASSAYLLSLIKSIHILRQKNISEFEVCKIAEIIEKKFNPLVGQQDFYGSMGGLKKINFYKEYDPTITFLSSRIFEEFDMYLIYTGIIRNSTNILESIDIDKSVVLLEDVRELETAINICDVNAFNNIINRTWESKKKISPYICENTTLIKLDNRLKNDSRILSHKLCGAGNGGYFLIFSEKEKYTQLKSEYINITQITISEMGLKSMNLKNEFTKL
jgi:D-glycero-alpha-D-manno-heptose-7-phosphate kinase